MKTPFLSIIVPVFNEKKTIKSVLERLRKLEIHKEIIIVDDNSTDGTKEILKLEETAGDINVVYRPENNGRGAALKDGVRVATGEYIIFQDADLELDPTNILSLLEPVSDGLAEVVFGSRFLGKSYIMGMGISAYWGNIFFSVLTRLLYKSSLTDVLTCYQLMKRETFSALNIRSDGFSSTIEITAKLLKSPYHIYEVPISYTPRGYMEGKKIYWNHGFSMLSTLIKCRLNIFL